MGRKMTDAPPAAPTPPAAPAPTPPAPTPPKAPDKQPPWGDKPEDFDADKAWDLIQNLRKEKGGDPNLTTEIQALRDAQESQRAALAAALGVTPETVSDETKLAQQVESLKDQILLGEKRALSAEFKVPVEMLTMPDAASLRSQATSLAAFAEAAHYAASSAAPATPQPEFQQIPGQGQPSEPQAGDDEYDRYYPAPGK